MKRLIVLLLGALALCLPSAPSYAQTVSAKTVTACGTPGNTPVIGVPYPITQDTTGVLCTSSSGGGGGSASYTAAAAPFSVSAGVNKPAGISTTNSAAWTIPVKPGTTTEIDLSNQCVWGVDAATCASLANPFPTLEPSTSATGSAVPAKATYMGAASSGNVTGIIQADASAAISVSTGTTTQIVALSSSKKIYITAYSLFAGGTGNATLEYGTGSNCGTGTTVLTGIFNLTAQSGIAQGTGLGPILVVPASNALCILTSASVQISGSVAYTQF